MNMRVVVLCSSLVAAVVGSPASVARAETVVPAKDPADALMKKMLDALKANDYAGFLADGTAKHKTLSKGAFRLVSAHFGAMLMKGYKTTALTILRKPDATIHLWKLEPAGAPEDFEVKVVLRDGKVDVFSIQ